MKFSSELKGFHFKKYRIGAVGIYEESISCGSWEKAGKLFFFHSKSYDISQKFILEKCTQFLVDISCSDLPFAQAVLQPFTSKIVVPLDTFPPCIHTILVQIANQFYLIANDKIV